MSEKEKSLQEIFEEYKKKNANNLEEKEVEKTGDSVVDEFMKKFQGKFEKYNRINEEVEEEMEEIEEYKELHPEEFTTENEIDTTNKFIEDNKDLDYIEIKKKEDK